MVKDENGFSLIEVLVVMAVVFVLTIVVFLAINPLEQLQRAKDSARMVNANEMLKAIERYQGAKGSNPSLNPATASIACGEIVETGPVVDLGDLQGELSSWFGEKITKEDNYLYTGILPSSGLTKVCYQVDSTATKTRLWDQGCFVDSEFYLCVPS